jgi:hypothetical protein
MQPLDVSFMSPFKTYYFQEIENWLKYHENRVVTIYREIISLGDENTANARCDSASAVPGALLLPSPLA